MEAVLSSVHALIYDAMMLHPTSKLLGMETWDHMWTKVSAGQSAFDQLKLPSFSLPPSEYITHIGEHLLTLVQQLEPLFVKHRDSAVMQDMRGGGGREGADADADAGLDGDADADGADSDDNDALFWLEMVSQGVVKLLLAKMQKIKKLSPLGSKHLSSDMDYLINVLRALGLQMDPLALAVKQVLDITSKEEVAKNEVVFNVSAPSDKAVLQTIVDIRQLGVKL